MLSQNADDKLATASFDGTCVIWACVNGEYEQVCSDVCTLCACVSVSFCL